METYNDEFWTWLDFLRPFTSVEGLYVSELPRFALVLEEIAKKMVAGELTEEVLPDMRVIQFETQNTMPYPYFGGHSPKS